IKLNCVGQDLIEEFAVLLPGSGGEADGQVADGAVLLRFGAALVEDGLVFAAAGVAAGAAIVGWRGFGRIVLADGHGTFSFAGCFVVCAGAETPAQTFFATCVPRPRDAWCVVRGGLERETKGTRGTK